ncbi:MAG: Ser-Thr-rich GPI-anchored membrane family protein [Candidatus Omnitrophota bacterium]|jgi:hypothetical protein
MTIKRRTVIKKRLAITISLVSFLFIGASFLAPEAYSYQVKRVVSGQFILPVGTESNTTDIDTPTQLNGDPLDVTNSFLIFGRRHLDEERYYGDVVGYIDDPTSLLFSRVNSGRAIKIDYQVVEFESGAEILTGVTTMPESRYNKTIYLPRDFNMNRTILIPPSWKTFTQSNYEDERNIYAVNLTSKNTLWIGRSDTYSNYNSDLAYQIVEFDRDINVTSGTSVISGTLLNVPVSVDANKTLLLFSTMPSSNVAGIEGYYHVRGYLLNNNTMRFQRYSSGSGTTVTIYWYLAEFANEVIAKHGTDATIIGTGVYNATRNITINPQWALNRSFIFHSTQANTTSATNGEDTWTSSELQQPTEGNVSAVFRVYESSSCDDVQIVNSYCVIEFPPLDLISPNGGENWSVGENQTISWNYAKSSKDHSLTLKLCKAGCSDIANYSIIIADNVNATNGSYNWWINNTVNTTASPMGESLRVAVIDKDLRAPAQNSRSWDISNGDFKIKGAITNISSPYNGSTWYVGDNTYDVSWTKRGDLSSGNFTIQMTNSTGAYVLW